MWSSLPVPRDRAPIALLCARLVLKLLPQRRSKTCNLRSDIILVFAWKASSDRMKVFCSKKFKVFLQKEKCFIVDLEWVLP